MEDDLPKLSLKMFLDFKELTSYLTLAIGLFKFIFTFVKLFRYVAHNFTYSCTNLLKQIC